MKKATNSNRYFKDAKKPASGIKIERFLTDMFHIMLSPVKFFGGMKNDGKYEDTVVKVLIYGLITAGIKIVFSIASISLLSALTSLIVFGVHAVLISFGVAGIALFFSYMAKGEMDFEKAFKAVAGCIFMYPLSFVAYRLAFAYPILFFLSIALDLYIVFLIYNIVIYALKGNAGVARVVCAVFAVFVIVLHFSDAADGYLAGKNRDVVLNHAASKIAPAGVTAK